MNHNPIARASTIRARCRSAEPGRLRKSFNAVATAIGAQINVPRPDGINPMIDQPSQRSVEAVSADRAGGNGSAGDRFFGCSLGGSGGAKVR